MDSIVGSPPHVPSKTTRNWLRFASTKPDLSTLTACRQANYGKLRLALFCHFSDAACSLFRSTEC